MNFDQWKKLNIRRQKIIAKSWDIRKGEGLDIAGAILRAFILHYGSNIDIEIDAEIIKLRDNAGWAIGVQCFNKAGLKIIPKNYLGIAVSRLHIDHIDDTVFSQFMPQMAGQSPTFPLSRPYKGTNSRLLRKKALSHRLFTLL